MSLSSSERARYQRHLALAEIGVPGQEKLKAARVLVVGAGGLGSPAALYLAAAGCGTLGLLDCDRVELSNLQRQVLFDSAVIAKPKAEAGRERLASLNPEIRVVAHALELKAANVRAVLENYDLVIDGTDRLSTRYLINDACVLLGLPLVSAAIHRFEGQVMTYVPGRGPCYRCLFPQAADGMVARILRNDRRAVESAKETIFEVIGRTLDEQLKVECLFGYALCGGNPAVEQRSQQFLEKKDAGRAGVNATAL